MNLNKTDFDLTYLHAGVYRVVFTNPKRRDYYVAVVTDMTLIDDFKVDYPKQTHLLALKEFVKTFGNHYNKQNELIS